MIIHEQFPLGMSLAIVWRNPLGRVRADLRARERNSPIADGLNKPSRSAHGDPIGT